MLRVPVYILAGGKSSRFGSDKARAIFHDQPLITHVQQLLQNHASRVTVVARTPDQYADLGLRTIGDAIPGQGPLGGLMSALDDLAADEPWLLLCSCDAVVIDPSWLDALLAQMQAQMQTQSQACQAIAFRGAYWQPMPALYAVASIEIVRRQVQSQQLRMQHLLDTLTTHALPLPANWPDRWQVNRPDDLNHFRA